MGKSFRILNGCCALIIVALLVVGAGSHGVIRHIVQTCPLSIAILLGTRNSNLTRWAALPCFVFWLLVMIAIWLCLLGWAQLLSGNFSPTEIALTMVVGLASVVGIIDALRMKERVHTGTATVTALLVAILQVAAFRLSFLPQVAHR